MFGTYSISFTISITLRLVTALTPGSLLMARETVEWSMPSFFAISLMVTNFISISFLRYFFSQHVVAGFIIGYLP
jgi:hypothetical protein